MPMLANVNRSWLVAGSLSAALALFIITADKTSATDPNKPQLSDESTSKQPKPLPRVAVAELENRLIERTLTLYGQTAPDRSVTVKAEWPARVIAVAGSRGELVAVGDDLIQLREGSLPARIYSAEARLKQTELDYQSALSLKDKNLIAANKLPELEVAVAQARSELVQLKIDLENTRVKVPLDGILNDRFVELGDYLDKGQAVADILDLDPLVIAVDIPQAYINRIAIGENAAVRFDGGSEKQATIRYKSSKADGGTRTFRAELSLPNPEMILPAGLSVEADLVIDQVQAFLVSPAMLSLDESGNPGVKWVDSDSRVQFTKVDIVKTEELGIWLAGLPPQARVIVRGHGFVREGDLVQAELLAPTLVSEIREAGE